MKLSLEEQLYKMHRLIRIAHKDQKYGDAPYIKHLHDVVNTLEKLEYYDSDEDYLLSAIVCKGHDLFEDTYITEDRLREEGFDEKVIDAIKLLTKVYGVSYKTYLRNISRDDLAWKVKMCDTYSNLTQSMKDLDYKRIRKYSAQLELLAKYKEE